jgi:hypothetical protein
MIAASSISRAIVIATLSMGFAILSPGQSPGSLERALKFEVSASKPNKIAGGDYDDKMQKITLRAKITNMDPKLEAKGLKAVFLVFGDSVITRGTTKVLLREEAALDLAPHQALDHTCQQAVTRFDKTNAIFGYSYGGWAVAVVSEEGKVVAFKSTSPSFEKLRDKVALFSAEKCYDRKAQVTIEPDRL